MEYVYQPLGSRDEIRILVLEPAASFDDDLHGRVVHRKYPVVAEDASGVNHWNATSYTWGSDPPSETFHIDSTFPKGPNSGTAKINIGPNLNAMLRHFRDKQLEHNLWVDAICLNQDDTAEKNQQIPCMKWIYSLASQVLIWLGADDGTARIGMKLVEALPAIMERMGPASDITTRVVCSSLSQQLGCEQPHALDRLFLRPWFGRRWILQEVALAQEAVVCCGRYQLPWDRFRAGMEILSDLQTQGGDPLSFVVQLMDDRAARAMRSLLRLDSVSGLFLDLLWSFDTSACQEKHDIIYAILFVNGVEGPNGAMPPGGSEVASSISFKIASDADLQQFAEMALQISKESQDPLAVSVDYETPWHLLFTQVASYFARSHGFGAVTRHLFAFGSLQDTNTDWPSWVPDWSRPRRLEPKRGISNVVPWARTVTVTDNGIHVNARPLAVVSDILPALPAPPGDVRREFQQFFLNKDAITVPGTQRDDLGDARDLTIAEIVIGVLIRRGLDIGICKPVAVDSRKLTEAWIVNDLHAHSIASTIFTSEVRSSGEGLWEGIMACLQSCSIFATSDTNLGISPATPREGDQIMLIDDYCALPEFDRAVTVDHELQAAAVLRPNRKQQTDGSMTKEADSYTLVGPCIVSSERGRTNSPHMRIRIV